MTIAAIETSAASWRCGAFHRTSAAMTKWMVVAKTSGRMKRARRPGARIIPWAMDLAPGARLKHYEIISLLGRGGMGAVYKAVDRRLDRLVAIKVLHHVSAERRQRFEREARVVASLQHPRICTLIDIGVHDGIDYLVMEYLDGRPLPCPQPFATVIEYGIQIADALDAAHRKGIAHRDLKPANIMVTGDGIKLLDFGIAKAADMETLTQEGVPVGTPGYMSPEQWRGESTDHRSDIFALGCVLHEMATGERSRETPIAHPLLESVVKGCLAQAPDDRWQSARDVRRLLAGVAEGRAMAVRRAPRWWIAAAAAVLAAVGAGALAWSLKPAPARAPLYVAVMPPPNAEFHVARNREGGIAVSPDGTMIAFVATTAGRAQLWIRRLDSADARPLPGTEGAFYPFWSPDSQWIAFFTPDKLMKIGVAGGAPRMICTTIPRALGGSWGANDQIVVTGVQNDGAIQRVAGSGGTPVPLAAGAWPHFLPDGRRFLFSHEKSFWIGSVDGGEAPRRILEANTLKTVYSNGHLLFVREQKLLAQPFDLATMRVTGDPYPIAESLAGAAQNPGEFDATAAGLLIYATGDRPTVLVWRARDGRRQEVVADGAELATPRLAPDNTRVAFARVGASRTDIWIADLRRKVTTRVTFELAVNRWPVWSPDGARITYAGGTELALDLYRRAADGGGAVERLTNEPSWQHPMDWSSDGFHLVFTRNSDDFGTDLMILPAGGKPYMYLRTPVSEAHSQLEPKSRRWIVYSSDDIGRREVFVQAFAPGQPAAAARWQISSGGGTMPRWRGDGKEIYYWGLDGRIMAATVDGTGSAFKWSTPAPLFQAVMPTLRTNDINFDVSADGERFLLVEPADRIGTPPLMMVTDWLAAVRRRSQ
jgi:Tol biopolymer transport system component/predicted Ser/Thr protein kinase